MLLNQALHWNGRKWALVPTPDPSGTAPGDVNALISVRCPSVTNCLAIGTTSTNEPFLSLNQAQRWNGKKWSVVSVPSPGGKVADDFSELFGLACTSADNCFAVGVFGSFASPGTRLNQVLHWNGSSWSQIIAPQPDGAVPGASQELDFVTCGSPTSCWAVGDYASPNGGSVTLNQAQHWDGGQWSLVATPEPAGTSSGANNALAAVRCVSRANCWAVGAAQKAGGQPFAQILHWDGSQWSAR